MCPISLARGSGLDKASVGVPRTIDRRRLEGLRLCQLACVPSAAIGDAPRTQVTGPAQPAPQSSPRATGRYTRSRWGVGVGSGVTVGVGVTTSM